MPEPSVRAAPSVSRVARTSTGDPDAARGQLAPDAVIYDLAVSLPLDVRAPGAARIVVEQLRGWVLPADVLEIARTTVRLVVEDPGRGGAIAPRAPDLQGNGGFGPNLVRALSERWGFERPLAGGMRVWGQLPRAPMSARAVASGFAFIDAGRSSQERHAEQHARRGRAPGGGRWKEAT